MHWRVSGLPIAQPVATGQPRPQRDVREFAIVHPQLCVDDGERLWKNFAKPGQKYLVGGCDPRMQRKMYKDALAEVGLTEIHDVCLVFALRSFHQVRNNER